MAGLEGQGQRNDQDLNEPPPLDAKPVSSFLSGLGFKILEGS